MRRLLILPLVGALVFGLALTVLATHFDDGGIDEPWVVAMNQETYWEARFGAECTQYTNHSGFIPEQYDAAVVKDGNFVRVYANVGGAFTAIGAVNPANGQHFAAPHSWVMKCTIDQTTTTTQPEETTTTENITTTTQPSTSTSSTSPTTTTTQPPTTTVTLPPESSTTTTPESTSTTLPAPTTTAPTPSTTDPSNPELAVLPYTGIEDWLAFAAFALIGAGLVLARGFRAED